MIGSSVLLSRKAALTAATIARNCRTVLSRTVLASDSTSAVAIGLSLNKPCSYYSTTQQRAYNFDRFGGGNIRFSSSPSLDDSIDIGRWPLRKTNTVLNIVPQGQKHIVERLGRLHSVEESGYFFAIPFIDEVAYIIDVRERAIDIQPQVRWLSRLSIMQVFHYCSCSHSLNLYSSNCALVVLRQVGDHTRQRLSRSIR